MLVTLDHAPPVAPMDEHAFERQLHQLIGVSAVHLDVWQMCVRAVVVFVFGLVVIRLFARKAFGMQTPLDIVLAIVVGSNLSRTLTGEVPFLPTLAATAVLAAMFWLFNHLAIRWGWFGRLVKGMPVTLARDGRLDRLRMRRTAVGEADLEEAARQSGLGGLDAVEDAVLERSGKISAKGRKPLKSRSPEPWRGGDCAASKDRVRAGGVRAPRRQSRA